VHKIAPHLWFDREAVAAAQLYSSIFPNSKVTDTSTLHGTPSGDVDVVSFELFREPFMAISAGPLFKFTPAISFVVRCSSTEEVDQYWDKLAEGGTALMPLDAYPFSERYGWVEDRYGLSWQVMHAGDEDIGQRIIPTLMFAGEVCGKAEDAVNRYTSVFPDAKVGATFRYGQGEEPDQAGTIRHVGFTLAGQEFAAMDSAQDHGFGFNEAISLMVQCDTQEEIDHYWNSLSAVPEAEQCGWLKDNYGVSWQIVPAVLDELLGGGDKERTARVTATFLDMKKLDMAELQKAYEGAEAPAGGER
jgi:predicted 3-demethylubiquinone-9 3-methyltransferase (glyoxalase superfamily)